MTALKKTMGKRRGRKLAALGIGLVIVTGCTRHPYADLTPEQVRVAAQAVHPPMPSLKSLPPGQRGRPVIITRPPEGK